MIEDSSSFIAFTKHGLSKEAPGWCTEIDFPNQKTKIHFPSWRVTSSSSNLLYVMYNNTGYSPFFFVRTQTPVSLQSSPKTERPNKDGKSVCLRIGDTTVLWAPIPNRFLRNAHLPTTRSFLLFFFFSSSSSRKSNSCLAVSPSCARASLSLSLSPVPLWE